MKSILILRHPLFIVALASAVGMASALADSTVDKKTINKIYHSLFSGARTSETKQKRSRSNSTVMGIRGLASDQDAQKKYSAAADLQSVYEMEDRLPDEALIQKIEDELKLSKEPIASPKTALPLSAKAPSQDELRNEIVLGRKMAAQILGANRPLENDNIQKYATALVAVIAQNGMSEPRPFRVSVLDTEQINAFACPGGYIFVTKGALRASASEGELAALLGHEIAHVTQRHLLSSMRRRIESNKPPTTRQATTNPHLQARRRIQPEASVENSSLARMLGPKGVGLTVLQASSEALETLLSKGLEREFELEADTLGTLLSTSLGFSAPSLSDFLGRIESKRQEKSSQSFQTHPPFDIRQRNLLNIISKQPSADPQTKINSSAYAQAMLELQKQ